MHNNSTHRIRVMSDRDILEARQEGCRLASSLRLASSDLTVIAVAISEVARNIVMYAGAGDIDLALVEKNGRRGIAIHARDGGPGIDNLSQALQEGYSTSGGLGLGLAGARRLMDDFDIRSARGKGTTIMMRKWER